VGVWVRRPGWSETETVIMKKGVPTPRAQLSYCLQDGFPARLTANSVRSTVAVN
jgi:hypothetical protein